MPKETVSWQRVLVWREDWPGTHARLVRRESGGSICFHFKLDHWIMQFKSVH